MAELKTSPYYNNLGGVNKKVSEYELTKTEFLNLRNVDFDVPNALQKRPGLTQMVSPNTSGPITGLFEFVKLNGSSWIVAGSNTALFYLASGAYTLLDPGWNNGQPQDMLTFVNKLWIADGGRYKSWDGGETFGLLPAGAPCAKTQLSSSVGAPFASINGSTWMLVAGATMLIKTGGVTFRAQGVFVAYSYVREDGYAGPADFLSARNLITTDTVGNGDEWFDEAGGPNLGNRILRGFTIPTGAGISSLSIWLAVDVVTQVSNRDYNIAPAGTPGATLNGIQAGALGWRQIVGSGFNYMSVTMKPNADLSRFHLFTTISGGALFSQFAWFSLYGSTVGFALTMAPVGANGGGLTLGFWADASAGSLTPFSAMPFCWFDSNTPKYIDINQNVMFTSGFSNTPSVMWFSDIGQPESIQPEYNFEIRTNDGDRIIAHRGYNGNIIVFKTGSFHKVIGSTPDDFQLVELSLEFGAVSNNAIVEYNEKLLFLDKKGIVRFDGASWQIISDDIDEIFRVMNLDVAYEKAVGIHNLYRNQVWFGIPVDGATQNNLTVVWDYLIDAWTFFDGFNPASFAFIKSTFNKPTVWHGNYSGMIFRHNESFLSDNGAGISCVVLSRFDKFVGENCTSVWRRLFLDVSPVTGITGVINGRVFSDYNKTSVQATFTMYQSAFQSRAEMGVVGKAMAFEASHNSVSLPFLMNGYTWAKRFLRDV